MVKSIIEKRFDMRKFNGISLFTGAGGMDVGFQEAGINIIAANELNKYAGDTYAANNPNTLLIRGDLIQHLSDFENFKNVDIVFGGPPCQGFSVAGKMNPEDERSQLIWRFLDVIEITKPRVFVMENVKALATLDKWQTVRDEYFKRVSKMGYFCHAFLLNSADFGVSQKRERVFFIGSKYEYKKEDFEYSLNRNKSVPLTLRNLLSELPQAGNPGNEITCTAKITLALAPVMRKSHYAGMLFNGMGRPLNLDGLATTLPASMGGNKTPIIDEDLLNSGSEKDWVKDYHSRIIAGELLPEYSDAPKNLRRITIAEAALIQSFPRDYIFRGSKSSIYTQIGNAVPCKLAQAVASAVIEVCLADYI